MTEHSCDDTDEDALIAHGWRQDGEGSWCRDDCAEQGCAWAACISRMADGRYTGPACGPYGDGPFHATLEEAKEAYDRRLSEQGWTLLDTPPKILVSH